MSGRPVKSPGLLGSLIAISSPNVLVVDVESTEVTKTGSWTVVSDADAVGSSYRESAVTNNALSFSFEGSALWIRFKLGPDCGKATVTLDGTATELDLYNALDAYKYVSVAVGLDETATHTVTIKVEGTKNSSSSDYKVKVDAYTYRLTEEALSLHSIEYLDLINVINTINKIGQIVNIAQIDNITTLGTVNEIKTVDSITSVGEISAIYYAALKIPIFVNGDFEAASFLGYFDYSVGATIDATVYHLGKYSCKMANTLNVIRQRIPKCYGDEIAITFYGLAEHDGDKIELIVSYMDGSTDFVSVNQFTAWNSTDFVPTTHKIVDYITFATPTVPNVGNVWIDEIDVEGVLLSHVSIVDKITDALPTGTNSIGQVTANAGTNLNTSALATETTLGTIHGHVDSIDGKITACNTGAVVLATGAAAIGKLAANSGIDIGDVDVTSVVPLTGATNLGKAVDSALGATDTGVMVLAVRDDTLNIRSGAENDYEPLHVDATGRLYTNAKHDSKVYAPAIFDAAASGNLVAAVANKVTKLHALAIQAQGTVVVNLNNGSGGASLMEWSFQAREGAVLALAPSPAYWAITGVNTILYVTLSAAVQVTITAIVSSDDAS